MRRVRERYDTASGRQAGTPSQLPVPRPGDLLIEDLGRRGYGLAVVPSAPQIRWKTRDGITAMACRFAKRAKVDCWFKADGSAYSRIAHGASTRR